MYAKLRYFYFEKKHIGLFFKFKNYFLDCPNCPKNNLIGQVLLDIFEKYLKPFFAKAIHF